MLILKYLEMALKIIAVVQTAIPSDPGPVKKAVAVALLDPPEAEKADVGQLVDKLVNASVAVGAWAKDQPPAVPIAQQLGRAV